MRYRNGFSTFDYIRFAIGLVMLVWLLIEAWHGNWNTVGKLIIVSIVNFIALMPADILEKEWLKWVTAAGLVLFWYAVLS